MLYNMISDYMTTVPIPFSGFQILCGALVIWFGRFIYNAVTNRY